MGFNPVPFQPEGLGSALLAFGVLAVGFNPVPFQPEGLGSALLVFGVLAVGFNPVLFQPEGLGCLSRWFQPRASQNIIHRCSIMAYWRLFYHVTWATADHNAIIDPVWQNSLHNVIAAESKELDALVYAVGGSKSQIHLAASIPPSISLSTFTGKVKGASSHFTNKSFSHQTKFRWQPKFGIVSFRDEKLDMVVNYVKQNNVITKRIPFLEKCYVRQGEWILPFWRLYYHFVWTTRYREPIIDPQWEPLLYDAIISKCEEFGAEVYALGGIEDHVHLAVSVPPKVALSTFIGDLKGFSSCFVNDNLSLPYDFYWQSKYGVTSFGHKMLDNVIEYVNNQKEHHKEKNLIPHWEQTG